ncbi:ACT domain-containing protein [Candidatus Thorarchaeota archaeon]|nr:MAG: ACT domain-containing protein [Candidatus Thorarchaeota archaeon]
MPGYRELSFLLKNMEPAHVPGSYIFATVSEETLGTLGSAPMLVFREEEAITVIVTREIAEAHSIPFESAWGLITLTVHSDLEAVGLLAKITSVLAEAGIGTNAVSAFYHDHLFVPEHRVSDTLSLLRNLSNSIVV